jgi:NADPH-dependent curcumin reductase CurA
VASCFQKQVVPPIPTDAVQPGQALTRTLYVSVDASNRYWLTGGKSYTDGINPGDIMRATAVAEVIFSSSSKLPVGQLVLGILRLQKYNLIDEKEVTPLPPSSHPHHYLGLLGISGLTAYIGL